MFIQPIWDGHTCYQFDIRFPEGFQDVGLGDGTGTSFTEIRLKRRRLAAEEKRIGIAEKQAELTGERQEIDKRLINLNEAKFLRQQVLNAATLAAEQDAQAAVNQFAQDEDFVSYGQKLLPLMKYSDNSGLLKSLEVDYNNTQKENRKIQEDLRKAEAEKQEKVNNLSTLLEGVTDEDRQTLTRKLTAAEELGLDQAALKELGLIKGKAERADDPLVSITIGGQDFRIKQSEAFKHAAARELEEIKFGRKKEFEEFKGELPGKGVKPDAVSLRLREKGRNISQNLRNRIPGIIRAGGGFLDDEEFVKDLDALADIDAPEAQYVRSRAEWAIAVQAGEPSTKAGIPLRAFEEMQDTAKTEIARTLQMARRGTPGTANNLIKKSKTPEGQQFLSRSGINPAIFRAMLENLQRR